MHIKESSLGRSHFCTFSSSSFRRYPLLTYISQPAPPLQTSISHSTNLWILLQPLLPPPYNSPFVHCSPQWRVDYYVWFEFSTRPALSSPVPTLVHWIGFSAFSSPRKKGRRGGRNWGNATPSFSRSLNFPPNIITQSVLLILCCCHFPVPFFSFSTLSSPLPVPSEGYFAL